jgi:hypothetical protein
MMYDHSYYLELCDFLLGELLSQRMTTVDTAIRRHDYLRAWGYPI